MASTGDPAFTWFPFFGNLGISEITAGRSRKTEFAGSAVTTNERFSQLLNSALGVRLAGSSPYLQVADKRVSMPCMGIELRNGKIAACHDYWDLKIFGAQLHGPAPANI